MNKKIFFSVAVFVAGLCSIVYELLISTAATYFLGNGVKQFSIIIGVYLFSMGIGAYLSKFHNDKSLDYFIKIEYLLGLIGGVSVPIIYFLFVNVSTSALQLYCLGIIFVIGLLTGMEVPLLTFARSDDVRESLASVLSLDYLGGLIATLIFPFALLPFIGLFHSSLLFGGVNILLGLVLNIKFFRHKKGSLLFGSLSLLAIIVIGFFSNGLLQAWDDKIYRHPIVYNEQSSYQKIVLTKDEDDLRLYLNRVIQFSSKDEHRYHESLVHTPMCYLEDAKKVLILGGGENLASREVLKHLDVDRIDVVDIDPTIFHLSKTHPDLLKVNKGAGLDSRVHLIAEDALTYLNRCRDQYDLIISDLPDPSDQAIARLYSRQFYYLVQRCLAPEGIFVTQAGEIYFANTVFSCINRTLSATFEHVKPYHVYIPSFGDWGFIMASLDNPLQESDYPLVDHLAYLTPPLQDASYILPTDLKIAETKVNTLDNPVILEYYLRDWNKWKADFTHSVANVK